MTKPGSNVSNCKHFIVANQLSVTLCNPVQVLTFNRVARDPIGQFQNQFSL